MINNFEKINKSLIKRNRSEKTFKFFGLLGIIFAISFLVVILSSIFIEGKKAFVSTYIQVEVFFDSKIIEKDLKKFGWLDLTTLTSKNTDTRLVLKFASGKIKYYILCN